ncbi:ferredoxin [Streptomyces sp. NPDC088353]|uniref:ferredoxin n=1 Tax=Streptomyces sp. NPDC088353 TaxID=3365855 RepID=UPI0037F888F9
MHLETDTTRCVASGQCALSAPAVFDQEDDDDKVIVLDAAPTLAEHSRTRQAAALCPAGAIHVHGD